MRTSITRRLMLAAGLAVAMISQAFAQASYPNQTIKMILPFPPGGSGDAVARMIMQKLQESWGQPAIVDNRPGAGGIVANQIVLKAPPDGHTILFATPALMVQLYTMEKLPYDPLTDFAPVVVIGTSPSVLVVPPASPAKSLKEFVALVKANPGKYNFGSYGAGSPGHIWGSLLKLQSGLDLVHVPYGGAAPLTTSLLGGQLTSGFLDAVSARPYLQTLRPLAVNGPKRLRGMGDVPTFLELGYQGFEPVGWFSLFLPAKTPQAVVQKLSAEINRILLLPDVKANIESIGLEPGGGTPEEFQKSIRNDAPIYARIIKEANIRLTP